MSARSQEAAAVVVTGYHAHVYFDPATRDQAWSLRNLIEENFDIEMGRFREKPVGHISGSVIRWRSPRPNSVRSCPGWPVIAAA